MSIQDCAENIYLLYKSSNDILNSLYTVSKLSVSPKNRPSFLSKKPVESIIKKISKEFPNISEIASRSNCSEFTKINTEIIEATQPYYNAIVDLYTFKESFNMLYKQFNTIQGQIQIVSHSQISIYLLDVFTSLIRSFLLLNNIEDIIKIIGSYGLAFLLMNNTQDFSFLNISKMIVSYSDPYKKLSEEFSGLFKHFENIISGIVDEFRLNCLDGKQMQTTYYYNITALSKSIAIPNHFHIPEFQYYTYHSFYIWIVYTTFVFPNLLLNLNIESTIYLLLSNNIVLTIHRDLYILPHKELISSIDSIKGLSKKSKEINECLSNANSLFISFHKDRRDYFTSALHEARLIIEDQPGLLGPKFDRILQLLSHTFDCIFIWFAHFNCDTYKSKKISSELFDSNMFYCIYEAIQIKNLILKYQYVIKRYFTSFIIEYDLPALQHIQKLKDSSTIQLSDNDLPYLDSFIQLCEKVKSLGVDLQDNDITDMFLAMNLDWLRLQFKSVFGEKNITQHIDSCCTLNNMSFHCRILYDLYGLCDIVFPIHKLWYFSSLNELLLRESIAFPSSWKYISVSYGIYNDFEMNCDKLYAGERTYASEMCFKCADEFINIVIQFCVNAFSEFWKEYKEILKYQNIQTSVNIWLKRFVENKKEIGAKLKLPTYDLPGIETQQILRHESFDLIRNFHMLTEFCQSLCFFRSFKIANHVFFPRQSILPHLETFIKTELTNLLKLSENTSDKNSIPTPIRPSVFLEHVSFIQQTIGILANMLDINLDTFFYSILLSMSMPKDVINSFSISSFYASWFVDVFLESDFITGTTLFTLLRRSFISKSSSTFRSDEYTDTNEMRALVKIVGFLGAKTIIMSIDSLISNTLYNMKKFISNIPVSTFEASLNSNQNMDSTFKNNKILDETINNLIKIGAAFALKELLNDAIKYTLETTSPGAFLSLEFQHQKRFTHEEVMPKMFHSFGFDSEIDFELLEKLMEGTISSDAEKAIWTENFHYLLLLVVGYIGTKDDCEYITQVDAYTNNLHLIILAYKKLIPCFYYRFRFNGGKQIHVAMQDIALSLSKLVIRISNGTLVSTPIKNRENYFVLLNILARDNFFLSGSVIEQIIPSCLITSANDKIIRTKSSRKTKV